MPLSPWLRYLLIALLVVGVLRWGYVATHESGQARSRVDPRDLAPPSDIDSTKHTARWLAAEVELCFARTSDFARCDSREELGEIGITLGSGPNEAEVRIAERDRYEVVARASNGMDAIVAGSKHTLGNHTCFLPGASCGSALQ